MSGDLANLISAKIKRGRERSWREAELWKNKTGRWKELVRGFSISGGFIIWTTLFKLMWCLWVWNTWGLHPNKTLLGQKLILIAVLYGWSVIIRLASLIKNNSNTFCNPFYLRKRLLFLSEVGYSMWKNWVGLDFTYGELIGSWKVAIALHLEKRCIHTITRSWHQKVFTSS